MTLAAQQKLEKDTAKKEAKADAKADAALKKKMSSQVGVHPHMRFQILTIRHRLPSRE